MNDRLITSVAVLCCSYLVSTVLIFPVRVLAIRFGVLDRPGNRKCHKTPVPRLGGLAIFGSLVIVIFFSLFYFPRLESSFVFSVLSGSLSTISQYTLITWKLWALFGGALVITLVGLLDDVLGVNFSPYIKLGGQIAAAIILMSAGIILDLFIRSEYLNVLVTMIWLVGITNSFNLLDNMDGLSSGIALICAFIFLVLAMLKGEFFIALLLSAMIGSTLGFFQFNLRGGYIFMGDSGSLLLGYLLAAVSVMAHYVDAGDASIFPALAPVIILGLPIFDTASVMFIRLREGRSVFKGDQMHLSHRLVRIGMTMRQAVMFNYLMAFTISVNALLIINSRLIHSFIAVFQVLALTAMVTILMSTQARPNIGEQQTCDEKLNVKE